MLGEVEAVLDLTRMPERKVADDDQDTPIIVEVSLLVMFLFAFRSHRRMWMHLFALFCNSSTYSFCTDVKYGHVDVLTFIWLPAGVVRWNERGFAATH